MLRFLLALALSLTPLSGAWAQTGVASGMTVTATGGTTARTTADRFAERINVRDRGAKGDVKGNSAVAITTGTPALVCAACSFAAADVGKAFNLSGAGTNNGSLFGTISAVADATHATLSVNAAETITSSSQFLTLSQISPVVTQSGSGSYAPGDTITIAPGSGTASTDAIVTVGTTVVTSATVNAGGSGGTNGACTVTGTTGTAATGFTRFSARVTIAANAISAVGSIYVQGEYTTNPTSLAAEPVTGCSLSGATLALKMGVGSLSVTNAGEYSVFPSTSAGAGTQGSTSGSGTGATFTLLSGISGAFQWGTDDSAAFALAESDAITQSNTGKRVAVYIPGGQYLIKGTAQTLLTAPVSIIGDGMHVSVIKPDVSFSGDIFSWSNDWGRGFYVRSLLGINDFAGVDVSGVTILGNLSAPAQQNAFMFYDQNDHFTVKDVDAYFLNGRCVSIGQLNAQSQGYMREAQFSNIQCWNSGTHLVPAFEVSSTAVSGGDATNTIRFNNIEVYGSAGVGVAIRNPINFNSTRLLDFYGLRSEASGFDDVDIGRPDDQGNINSVNIYGLMGLGVRAGAYGIKISSGNSVPYNISVFGGTIGPGNGAAIDVDSGSAIRLMPGNISTSGTAITTGPNITGSVLIDGGGAEINWTKSLDQTTLANVRIGTKIVPSGVLPGPRVSGHFYGSPTAAAPTNVAVTSASRLYATPVYIPTSSVLKTLAYDIGTGNGSGFNAEMCVYADTGSGAPGALVSGSDTGSVAVTASATGIQSSTLAGGGVVLTGPGWYWFAWMADSSAESVFSVNTAGGLYSTAALYGWAANNGPYTAANLTGVYHGGTVGSCPDPFGSPTYNTSAATPYIIGGF